MPVQHRLHARCACMGARSEDAASSSVDSALSTGSGQAGGGAGRPFAFATSPRQYERDRPFLVDHLALDLALDVPKKGVLGSATLTVRRVDPDADTLALDAIGFDIASVLVNGVVTAY